MGERETPFPNFLLELNLSRLKEEKGADFFEMIGDLARMQEASIYSKMILLIVPILLRQLKIKKRYIWL